MFSVYHWPGLVAWTHIILVGLPTDSESLIKAIGHIMQSNFSPFFSPIIFNWINLAGYRIVQVRMVLFWWVQLSFRGVPVFSLCSFKYGLDNMTHGLIENTSIHSETRSAESVMVLGSWWHWQSDLQAGCHGQHSRSHQVLSEIAGVLHSKEEVLYYTLKVSCFKWMIVFDSLSDLKIVKLEFD